MNEKVSELNLKHTHIVTPHGLDAPEHYTTAYELAIITDYALKNEEFCNIVGTKTYTITINGYPKRISNTNELLGNLDGVYGVKTGFTNGANRCLVTAVKRNDMDIICIVLGADTKKDRTKDSIKLIEYAFSSFERKNVSRFIESDLETWLHNNSSKFFVEKGDYSTININYSPFKTQELVLTKDNTDTITVKSEADYYHIAPILSNTIIGKYYIYLNNELLECGNLYVKTDIQRKNVRFYVLEFLKSF
jgi:D-alanyl-D-alanine carboxypeptidase (penicillin-binding protein 5/6)